MSNQIKIKINTEYITLQQALMFSGVVFSGAEAKIKIQEKLVKLNNDVETRRGKKIFINDIIEFDNKKIIVEFQKGVENG